MKIPFIFYGPFAEVRSRCRKALRNAASGVSWNDAFQSSELADTQDNPGLLVLHGPSPLLATAVLFHCYLPWTMLADAHLRGRLTDLSEEVVFRASLESAWGVLGLLAHANTIWLMPEERRFPFLEAALRFWSTLHGEGGRYSNGSTAGQDLWRLPTNLKFVLANLGAPHAALQADLPSGDLQALIRRIGLGPT
jgi:hypothetical protein